MFDAMKLLGSLMGNNGMSSGLGGQLLNGLAGSMSGRGRSGGMNTASLLGSLAMAAFQQFSQSRSSSPSMSRGFSAPSDNMGFSQAPAFDPVQANQQALIFVRAMINAAKADGVIDDDERQKIIDRLSDVGPEEIQFVRQEMAKPLNMDFLIEVDPSMASQVYAISLTAIELDTMAELNYLRQLAQQLRLTPQTVNGIHQQLGVRSIY